MELMILFSLVLLAVLPLIMLTQARPWFKPPIPGQVIRTAPLSFGQRLRFHRPRLLAVLLGLALGLSMGWLPTQVALLIAAFTTAVLFLPMHYTFTTEGLAIGQAIFRSWKEFGGISRQGSRITLEHPSRLGQVTLFVPPTVFDAVWTRIQKQFS